MKFSSMLSAYILFVFFIPSSVALVNAPGIPLLSVGMVYMLLLIVAFLLFFLQKKRIREVAKTYPFYKPMTTVMLSMLVVTVFAERFGASLNVMLAFFTESFLLSLMIWITYRKPSDINSVMHGMVLIFVGLSVYGTISHIVGTNPIMDYVNTSFTSDSKRLVFSYDDIERLGAVGRAQSIFSHPIQYGAFLVMLMCISSYLFISDSGKRKYIQLPYIMILAVGIIFTYSRAPQFMLIIIVIGYWYFQSVKSKLKMMSLFFILALALVLMPESSFLSVFSSIFLEMTGHATDVGGSSLGMRIEQLLASYLLFQDSPIVGHGLAATRVMSESDMLPDLIRRAESIVFSQAIDAGLLGLTAYIYFYYCIFKYFLRQKARVMETNLYSITIIAASLVLGYLAFIMVTGEINTFQLFIIIITLIARYIQLQLSATEDPGMGSKPVLGA